MKRKIFAALLALALALSLLPAALAAGFADVSDTATARNVEVLRLMGVIEGDDNAAFRPNSNLKRAEFCKMAVVLTGKRSVVARYGSRTVFPDVRASHWAAGYVNYAASADAGLIHGLPDGTFRPDRAITYGEAVTILMRLLGYEDKDTGGIWPDGNLALANEVGMTKNLTAYGGSEITRAQAARLFVNALTAQDEAGATLLAKLGYTIASEPVTLYSIDVTRGVMRTSGGEVALANPVADTALDGLRGYVVSKGGEAVTFLPAASTQGGAASDAAIIVFANGSTAGFDALTGGEKNYTIYRNGVRASANALRRYDVVTYNAASRTIQACDTRLVVYYENCTPSPSAPLTVTALNGTEFTVVSTAQQSLSRFKPGEVTVLQLTVDGRVAGAIENGTSGATGNAFGYVAGDGTTYLICGGSLKKLECVGGESVRGKAVRIAQNGKTSIYLSAQTSGATGALDLTANTLGTRKLAEGVLVFRDGALTSLAALGVSRVEADGIVYARTNTANEVDLIVLGTRDSGELVGKATVYTDRRYADADDPSSAYDVRMIRIRRGGTLAEERYEYYNASVGSGDFVVAKLNSSKNGITAVRVLDKIEDVPASVWIGESAVTANGRTYTIAADVLLWNGDIEAPMSDLAAARAYARVTNLYVDDGAVRAIEVFG